MISFRFHVVSITAIFLAIAIGVVVGSTYIDRITVDQLETRIDTVENNADATREENDRLESELSRARDFIELSTEYAVTDRLLDVPVAVIAVRGVDQGAVEDSVLLARRAGARVPGVIWLEPRWDLEEDGDVEALSGIVGGAPGDAVGELHSRAWDDVAAELAEEPSSERPLEEATTATKAADTLLALQEAGFISTDALGDDSVALEDLGGSGARVLVITGPRAEGRLGEMVPTILDSSVDAGLTSVVADVHVESQEGPSRAETLSSLLEPQDLRDRIVIVDDADREEGRLAAVLALHSAATGEIGLHFGYGEGADAVLPVWTAP